MKKFVFWGLLVISLVFGFIGCDTGNGSTATTYSITFNSNGGSSVQAITGITSGSTILLPENPTKADHNFVGWFIDNETFQNQFTSTTVITSNVTVFANWTLIGNPIECTTHEWEWVEVPHSLSMDAHGARTCTHCGEIYETRPPVTISPNFIWYGDGSASDFNISTPQSIFAFAHIVNGTADEFGGPTKFNFENRSITLTNNIDLGNQLWAPIGVMNDGFDGVFNGNGKKIISLYVNKSSNDAGLFGAIGSHGKIKNLGVHGNVSGRSRTGGIVGTNDGTVENSYFSGNVNGTGTVGGVVGGNRGADSIVINSHNTGNVTGSSRAIGGVVGINEGTVFGTFNTGNVTTGLDTGGGIVGNNLGTVSNSFNSGDIFSTNSNEHWLGGIVGRGGTVLYTYNIGSINSPRAAGGIVGHSSIVSNSISLGSQIVGGATVTSPHTRRIANRSNSVMVGGTDILENNRARYDMLLNGVTVSWGRHDNVDGEDVIPGTTLMSEVFAGWDTAIWDIPDGILTIDGPLPTLQNAGGEQNPTLPAVEE
jgi:uncharacterized repeat protein (TIGR02543 family)